MNTMQARGPSAKHWGIPEPASDQADSAPFRTVRGFLSARQFSIQSQDLPLDVVGPELCQEAPMWYFIEGFC